jgi:ATP-binding cassette subfamily A (ABC1) protein 3
LGDRVAVLAAPGKLLAEGSPVSLKSSLGEGYKIVVQFDQEQPEAEKSVTPATYEDLLVTIRQHAPEAAITNLSLRSVAFALKTKDTIIVQQILAGLENEERKGRISGYEVNGTTLEDIFLDLMGKDRELHEDDDQSNSSDEKPDGSDSPALVTSTDPANPHPTPLDLTPARPTSLLYQSLTIFYKRLLVLRRSWLSPLLAVVIACSGACIPLIFMNDRVATCSIIFRPTEISPLWLPLSQVGYQAYLSSVVPPLSDENGQPITDGDVIPRIAPPNVLDVLDRAVATIPTVKLADQPSFIQNIEQNVRNLSTGGIWVDTSSRQAVLAYEATDNLIGPTMLNLVSNVLFTSDGGADGRTIFANYMPFPLRAAQGLSALKWVRVACDEMTVILITPP